jgi:hypothetical protein
MGDRVKVAYGEFCSRHNEAMQLYKDLLKSDTAFQAFIKVSNFFSASFHVILGTVPISQAHDSIISW